jgi:hypothetical protein
MKRFSAIFLAILIAIFTAAMIVKSNQKWESNADNLVKDLTPDSLVTRCGLPAADIPGIGNRKMFYSMTRDRSAGLIFTFSQAPDRANWTYLSFCLGALKDKELVEIEDAKAANGWAIIELPCLNSKM